MNKKILTILLKKHTNNHAAEEFDEMKIILPFSSFVDHCYKYLFVSLYWFIMACSFYF